MSAEKQKFLSFIEKTGLKIQIIGPLFKENHDYIDKSLPTLFIDGGFEAKPFVENPLVFSLGDKDSYLQHEPFHITFSKNKDFSDLEWPLNNMPSSIKEIHGIGFTLGDRGHDLINFMIFNQSLDNKNQTFYRIDKTHYFFSAGHWQLTINGRFSILSLYNNELELNGDCEYTYKKSKVFSKFSSLGLSNRANGKIIFTNSAPLTLIIDDSQF